MPLIFFRFNVLTFAPFLILCYYEKSLYQSLGWSLICGFFVDLLSDHTPLGATAVTYACVTFCLYRIQFYFFEHRLSSLPLMVILFNLLATVLQIVILKVTKHPFNLSWTNLINALVLDPLVGAVYAILFFSLPSLVLKKVRRILGRK